LAGLGTKVVRTSAGNGAVWGWGATVNDGPPLHVLCMLVARKIHRRSHLWASVECRAKRGQNIFLPKSGHCAVRGGALSAGRWIRDAVVKLVLKSRLQPCSAAWIIRRMILRAGFVVLRWSFRPRVTPSRREWCTANLATDKSLHGIHIDFRVGDSRTMSLPKHSLRPENIDQNSGAHDK